MEEAGAVGCPLLFFCCARSVGVGVPPAAPSGDRCAGLLPCGPFQGDQSAALDSPKAEGLWNPGAPWASCAAAPLTFRAGGNGWMLVRFAGAWTAISPGPKREVF